MDITIPSLKNCTRIHHLSNGQYEENFDKHHEQYEVNIDRWRRGVLTYELIRWNIIKCINRGVYPLRIVGKMQKKICNDLTGGQMLNYGLMRNDNAMDKTERYMNE